MRRDTKIVLIGFSILFSVSLLLNLLDGKFPLETVVVGIIVVPLVALINEFVMGPFLDWLRDKTG